MSDWHFKATPRELQFFIVGILIGVAAYAIGRGLGWDERAFMLFIPLVGAFFVLAAVRT